MPLCKMCNWCYSFCITAYVYALFGSVCSVLRMRTDRMFYVMYVHVTVWGIHVRYSFTMAVVYKKVLALIL